MLEGRGGRFIVGGMMTIVAGLGGHHVIGERSDLQHAAYSMAREISGTDAAINAVTIQINRFYAPRPSDYSPAHDSSSMGVGPYRSPEERAAHKQNLDNQAKLEAKRKLLEPVNTRPARHLTEVGMVGLVGSVGISLAGGTIFEKIADWAKERKRKSIFRRQVNGNSGQNYPKVT